MENLVVSTLQVIAFAVLLIGGGLCLWSRSNYPPKDRSDQVREARFSCINANDFEPDFRRRLRDHLRNRHTG